MGMAIGILVVVVVGFALMSALRGKSEQEKNGGAEASAEDAGKSASFMEKALAMADKSKPASEAGVAKLSTHQLNLKQTFVGRRSAISDIVGKYYKEEVTLLGIYGESGMGKTTLATHLASKLASRYPDAQLYIDLKTYSKQPVSTAEAMAQVIWTYRPMAKLPVSPDDLAKMYLSVLHNQRAIVLLDNADYAKAKALVPPRSCLLLTVSRMPLSIHHMYNRKIDVLPPEESRELLKELVSRGETSFGEIIRLCDNLPLAIAIVGKFLGKTGLDPAIFLERLRAHRDAEKQNISKSDHIGLICVLSLIAKFLAEKTSLTWNKLLVFPGTFSSKASEFICDDEANRNLAHLVANGLVTHNPASDRYFLHEMTREYLRNHVNKVEYTAGLSRHANYFLQVVNTASALYRRDNDGAREALSLLDAEWGNIQAAFAWAEQLVGKDSAATKLCSSYVETGYDLIKMRLRPAARLKWLESALQASKITKDTEAEMNHLLNTGLEHSDQGSYAESIEYFQRVLELAKQLNKRDDEGVAFRHIGIAYSAMGDTARSLEFHQKELDLACSRGDKESEGKALASMGNAHKRAGNFPQAIEYFQRWLATAQETADQRTEGQALKTLADTQMEIADEIDPVLELYLKSLHIFQTLKDRHSEAVVFRGLGFAHLKMNNYPSATEFFEKSLVIFRKGRDIRNEGLTLHGMGMVYELNMNLAKALELYNDALKLFQKVADRRDQLPTLDRLARIYKSSTELDKAIKTYEHGLVLAREIADRRLEGHLLWEMSQTLDISGNRPKAIQHAESALKLLALALDPGVDSVKKKIEEWKTPGTSNG